MKETNSFWESVPLEELTMQQGVSATDDLDEIAARWPADDDPGELLRYFLSERNKRRKLGSNNEKMDRSE
jgi:hypothetical protein